MQVMLVVSFRHPELLWLQKETWYQLERDSKAGLDVAAMGMSKHAQDRN